MPYWAAAGMALGGLLGGAAQGGISYASAQQQQEAQRDAYKHRYQWTVEDLRKAGLNPVLAAQHGAGSVGPMAQMETPNVASALQVASQVGMQYAQADQASSQAAINQHTAREAKASADIAENTAAAFRSNPNLYMTRAENQAGINPSTVSGSARGLGERGYNWLKSTLNSLSSSAQGRQALQSELSPYKVNRGGSRNDYIDGGSITKYRKSR